MPGLKDVQTQFITQAPGPAGTLVGYVAASFRVFNLDNPAQPVQEGSVAMTSLLSAAIANVDTSNPDIVFVSDGNISQNLLIAVDVSNSMAPTIVDSESISA